MRTLFVRGFLVLSVLVLTSSARYERADSGAIARQVARSAGHVLLSDGAGRCAQFFAPLPNVLG